MKYVNISAIVFVIAFFVVSATNSDFTVSNGINAIAFKSNKISPIGVVSFLSCIGK